MSKKKRIARQTEQTTTVVVEETQATEAQLVIEETPVVEAEIQQTIEETPVTEAEAIADKKISEEELKPIEYRTIGEAPQLIRDFGKDKVSTFARAMLMMSSYLFKHKNLKMFNATEANNWVNILTGVDYRNFYPKSDWSNSPIRVGLYALSKRETNQTSGKEKNTDMFARGKRAFLQITGEFGLSRDFGFILPTPDLPDVTLEDVKTQLEIMVKTCSRTANL